MPSNKPSPAYNKDFESLYLTRIIPCRATAEARVYIYTYMYSKGAAAAGSDGQHQRDGSYRVVARSKGDYVQPLIET